MFRKLKKVLATFLLFTVISMNLSTIIPATQAALPPSTPITDPAPAAQLPAPLGAWYMNEGSGSKVYDYSGNGHNGVIVGTPTWQADGTFGSVLAPGNQYITTDTAYDLSHSFTISGWINAPAATPGDSWSFIMEPATSNADDDWKVYIDPNGYIDIEDYGAGSWNRGYSIQTDVRGKGWQEFAFTFDDSTKMLTGYLNGVQSFSLSTSSNPGSNIGFDPADALVVGALSNGGAPFVGFIAHVGIYNVAFTGAQVKTLAAETMPQPIGAWNLTEGTGNTVYDVSGAKHDGTIVGTHTWQTGDSTFGNILQPGSQYITTNTAYDLSKSFTISGWINVPASHDTWKFIMEPTSSGGGDWKVHVDPNGYISIENYGTGSWGRGYSIQTDVRGQGWKQFAFVFDDTADTITGYLNGAKAFGPYTMDNSNRFGFAPADNLVIGSRSNGTDQFDGSIAKIRIYNTALNDAQMNVLAADGDNVELMYQRSQLVEGNSVNIQRAMQKAESGQPITVALIGGSNTQGTGASAQDNCYASLVADWWEQAFPSSQVNFINAGIGSTSSLIGVSRIDEQVIAVHPDFVVVDFTANDTSDPLYQDSYEGIIRKLLNDPDHPGIMMMAFGALDGHMQGGANDLALAQHYNIPFLSYIDAVLPEINTGAAQKGDYFYFDDAHMNDTGHLIAANIIIDKLDELRDTLPATALAASVTNIAPLTANDYEDAYLLHSTNIVPASNTGWISSEYIYWALHNGWTSKQQNASITFTVNAKTLYLMYISSGDADAGRALVKIDGVDVATLDSHYNGTWDYPVFQQLTAGVTASEHTVEIINLDQGKHFDVLGLIAAGVAVQPQAPPAGSAALPLPLGAWNIDEGTGSTVYDCVKAGGNAAISGTPSWVSDAKFVNALAEGSTMSVNRGYDLSGSFTVSGWVNVDAGHNGFKFVMQSNTTNDLDNWDIHVNPSGQLVMENQSSSGWNRGYALDYDMRGKGWTHFAFVYDSSINSIYGFINGNEALSPNSPAASLGYSSADTLVIGSRSSGADTLDGQIAKVRIYNQALTSANIAVLAADEDGLHYVADEGPDEPDEPDEPGEPEASAAKLSAGWNLTEGSGSALAGVVAGAGLTAVSSRIAVWKADDGFGSVYDFSAGQYLSVANGVNLAQAFSITGYIKAPASDGSAYRAVFTKGAKNADGYWEMVVDPNGKLAIWSNAWSRGCDTDQTRVDDNAWHKFAFVYDGAHMNVYIDGVCVAQNVEMTCPASTASSPLRIGAYVDGELQFNGALARLRIYDGALAAVQLTAPDDSLTDISSEIFLPALPVALGAWSLQGGYADAAGRRTTPAQTAQYVTDSVFGKLFSLQNSQYLQIDGTLLLNDAFTVEGFLKVTASDGSSYRAKQTNGDKTRADFWEGTVTPTGKLSFYSPMLDRGVDSDKVRVDNDAWHSFAVVYKNGVMNLFVDGQCAAKSVAVARLSAPQTAQGTYVRIGAYKDGEMRLNGLLAGLRVYNTALTDERLAVLSANLLVGLSTSPDTGDIPVLPVIPFIVTAALAALCIRRKKVTYVR